MKRIARAMLPSYQMAVLLYSLKHHQTQKISHIHSKHSFKFTNSNINNNTQKPHKKHHAYNLDAYKVLKSSKRRAKIAYFSPKLTIY